ncbi:TBC1 domain family member 13-like [Gordionus sp. m RMFG-2023]|uniref:TBC1 domain family member 13-like n=1 Tax=Gordionus sp. m RMFG-2023 TaxID=3053472 RepID=UPI0031FC84E4
MEKEALFKDILSKDIIDKNILESLCFSGIPDDFNLRPSCWKLLLDYMPLKVPERNESLINHRFRYQTLLHSIIIDDNFIDNEDKDHPLNSHPNSYWSSYFKDNEILLQINKDVRRLCPHMQFFQRLTKYPNSETLIEGKSLTQRVHMSLLRNESLTKEKSGIINLSLPNSRHHDFSNNNSTNENEDTIKCQPHDKVSNNHSSKQLSHLNFKEYHWEVCQRILFVYAKLNPGQSYIQGMNEILGPIYYVMANFNDESEKIYAEHDSFFCFTNLMSEVRDNFIPHMDIDKDHGIGAQMKRLKDILLQIDPDIHAHFERQDLKLHYFCYRWLMLLFSQEFRLPDVIRLWDSIFSTTDKKTFCLYVSIAMLTLIRNQLLKEDFAHNLKLLQNYPNIDILKIISKSLEIEQQVLEINGSSYKDSKRESLPDQNPFI